MKTPFHPVCTPMAVAVAAALMPLTALAQAGAGGLDCMLQPSQIVQVGTPVPGVVQSVRVERGDWVRRGQPVVQMQAEIERAALAVARERASQVGELQATRGAQELAAREAERAAKLVEENFVSRTYFDRQRAEVQVASGRGTQAEERLRLAQREVQLAAAQLAQRTITAPIDGVVVERFAAPGEYVEQKPVLRIAAVDPLRVDVLVPAAHFGRVALGARVPVTPELLSREPRQATVTGVDRVVDAASGTFRVRLELPNPGAQLPPGLRCKADLGLGPAVASAMTPASPAAPARRPAVTAPVPAAASAPPQRPAPTAAPSTPLSAPPTPPSAIAMAPAGALAAQAQARRAEPSDEAVAPAGPLATQAQVRRAEPSDEAVAVAMAEVQRVKSVAAAPLIPATPAPLRLKMAPIEWPTAVATVTPRP